MQHYGFLIDGNFVFTSNKFTVKNRYSNKEYAEVSLAFENDIKTAIESACSAFQITKSLPSHKRGSILKKIAARIEDKKNELAEIITIETGKPIKLSRVEIERSITTFQFAAIEVGHLFGEVLPLDVTPQSENRFGITKRFPIGPVLAITPFNFPINLAAHKIAPAIAAGNSVIFKPASACMISGIKLAEIVNDCCEISGMINSIVCSGSVLNKFIADERIKKISFTGSSEIGWAIKKKAVKQKVTLELGGNAGVIVDENSNLEFAIPRLAAGSFAHAGQICIAVQRIFVHKNIYDEFEKRFIEETSKVKYGDPFDEDVIVGPMITDADAKRVEDWVDEAVKAGAKILIGGKREGSFYQPTILTNTAPEMKVNSMELFAPVVTLEKIDSFEEGIRQINNSVYGLQAGVFTSNLQNALAAYEKIEAGGVIINDYPTFRVDNMPYGGVKESGFGREGIRYAIEEMTELKLGVFNRI
jgi:glyceraldehyde-3-phosphate dehydrogenase (NADP+)